MTSKKSKAGKSVVRSAKTGRYTVHRSGAISRSAETLFSNPLVIKEIAETGKMFRESIASDRTKAAKA